MKTLNYNHKPKEIRNAKDLIRFVRGIPAKFWCVDARDNGKGQHCVLGHLDNAYGSASGHTDGFSDNELAIANNGVIGPYSFSERNVGAQLDGRSIKNRVLKLLRSKAK